MTQLVEVDEFLEVMADHVVIDVRAPGEFSGGHIPGAVNLPLFDDQQRATLGTLYKQKGRDAAVLEGLEIAGPKMRWLVTEGRRIAAQRPILLHCWRGGMRSASVAWVLRTAGMELRVLAGGYKAFRSRAQAEFRTPRQMIVLAGMTGAGKTTVLHEIAQRGEQVIDLERLANHRGSSFGGIGLPAQPTTEQFENLLFLELRRLDVNVATWLEDESPSIGKVRVPSALWWNMRRSPAIFLDVNQETRAENLVAEYGHLNRQQLVAATLRLQKKLGGLRTQQALALLERHDDVAVALSLLEYYDKSYRHAAEKRPRDHVYRLEGTITTDRILEFGRSLQSAEVS